MADESKKQPACSVKVFLSFLQALPRALETSARGKIPGRFYFARKEAVREMYDGKDRWQEEMARIRRARIRFSRHCWKRIRKRGITAEELAGVIKSGEIIQGHAPGMYRNNPDPVRVIMGRGNGERILHLVVALHGKTVILVTAYEPDPEIWENDRRTLRPR